jgi:hypothetical protein
MWQHMHRNLKAKLTYENLQGLLPPKLVCVDFETRNVVEAPGIALKLNDWSNIN